jgi:O-antigen ligase
MHLLLKPVNKFSLRMIADSIQNRHDVPNWWLFALLIACLTSLDFTPVSDSAIAIGIAIVAAFIACRHACMWLFYIAASQVVSDPASSPVTLAQIGILVWFCSLPFNRAHSRILDMVPFLRYVAPCVLWYYAASLAMRSRAPSDLLSGAIVGGVTFSYLVRSHVKSRVLLLSLILGTSFAAFGYWGTLFGLPVSATVNDSFNAGMHLLRTGGGRGDSNSTGMNITVLVIGTLSLATFRNLWMEDKTKHLILCSIFCFVTGIPALMLTFSRSAAMAILAGIFVLLLAKILIKPSAEQRIRVAMLSLLIIAIAASCTFFAFRNMIANYMLALEARTAAEQMYSGNGLVGARMNLWKTSFSILLSHPIAGAPLGTKMELDNGEVLAGTPEWDEACTHNIFLEFGLHSGFPGIVLFCIMFLSAPVALLQRKGLAYTSPIIVILVPVFFTFFNFSAISWKFYWALLALIIYMAGPSAKRSPALVPVTNPSLI